MRSIYSSLCLIVAAALLGGCAVGQKYNYQLNAFALPVSGDSSLDLLVKDERIYVLNGDKDADFVGLQRGGFGNPFNVTTASGQPLAKDVAESLQRSLEAKGFDVTLIDKLDQATAERVLILRMLEWKTDIYSQITLHYDLVLQVRDGSGDVLAQKELKGQEPIGGSKLGSSQNAKTATDALAVRVGSLFLDEAVSTAIE